MGRINNEQPGSKDKSRHCYLKSYVIPTFRNFWGPSLIKKNVAFYGEQEKTPLSMREKIRPSPAWREMINDDHEGLILTRMINS